jgi:hypothetical protein
MIARAALGAAVSRRRPVELPSSDIRAVTENEITPLTLIFIRISAKVEPDRMLDDNGRKPVTTV